MSEPAQCAIWDVPALSYGSAGRDGMYFDSPRSGGRYFISGRAQISIGENERYDDRYKARLTSWLVRQRRLGNDCPEVLSHTLDEAQEFRNRTVHKRANLLLSYIGETTQNIGDYFRLWPKANYWNAMAWSESWMETEVSFLLSYLIEKKWLNSEPLGDHSKQYALTVEGYARLAELANTYRQSVQAFVAMWFDESMSAAWKEGIEPGIRDAGYEPLRIDHKLHTNKIDDEIVAEIRRSRFIVADFTDGDKGARGSVYYEAGFAHGLNIPVIFTCREGTLKNIHFDTRQYAHIVWKNPEELRKLLADRISALIGDGPVG